MGNWHIAIQGTGQHHNQDDPKDANKMFQKFVAELRAVGHSIEDASFTFGGVEKENKTPPAE